MKKNTVWEKLVLKAKALKRQIAALYLAYKRKDVPLPEHVFYSNAGRRVYAPRFLLDKLPLLWEYFYMKTIMFLTQELPPPQQRISPFCTRIAAKTPLQKLS